MSRLPDIKDFTHAPLAKMKLSQGFGENAMPLYKELGLLGHNGWDIPCATGTEVFAVADGMVSGEIDGGYGVNARLMTPWDAEGLAWEVVYGHLKKVVKTGPVKAGDIIALSNNTGYSTGPHLHFGIRRVRKEGSGHVVLNHGNGFFGYLDPTAFYDDEPMKNPTLLPVDVLYGYSDTWERRVAFAPHWLWLITSGKWKHIDTRKFNALKYGNWDLERVLDEAWFATWSQMTKPEWERRLKA